MAAPHGHRGCASGPPTEPDQGEARERVSSEFGAACGWHRGRPFSPMQLARGGSIGNREDREWMRRGARSTLAWDHAEYFRRRRAPAGIIVHVYGEPPCADCHDLARTHGLEFKMLPWSWYYPTGTTAGLYLGRLADVVPFRRRA